MVIFANIFIPVLAFGTVATAASEGTSPQTVTLRRYPSQTPPIYGEKPDREGHRAPSRPLTCIISLEELQIPGIDSTEIYLYEVYDSDGEPLASFTEMSDFIEYIFSATETIEIRLHIEEFVLSGYLYI